MNAPEREEFPATVTVTVALLGIAREYTVVVPCHIDGTGYGYGLPEEDRLAGTAFTGVRNFISNTVMEAVAQKAEVAS